jgi:Flp pilus assembly protein TadG
MMSRAIPRFPSSPKRLGRFLRQDGGLAAVEFSLILPILVILWLAGVEVTQGLSVDRRLNNLGSSVGDLVARSKTVTYGDVDTIFDVAPGAMYPFCKTAAACTSAGLQMRVSEVSIDGSQNAKITWSRARGTTAYADNYSVTSIVPLTLRVANTKIIMSQAYFTYRPAVGYIFGSYNLTDLQFFVPRLADTVKLCPDTSGTGCKS